MMLYSHVGPMVAVNDLSKAIGVTEWAVKDIGKDVHRFAAFSKVSQIISWLSYPLENPEAFK